MSHTYYAIAQIYREATLRDSLPQTDPAVVANRMVNIVVSMGILGAR